MYILITFEAKAEMSIVLVTKIRGMFCRFSSKQRMMCVSAFNEYNSMHRPKLRAALC